MSVDSTHEHITGGGAWLELTEQDIVEYVAWLVDTATANGRQEGSEAAKESILAQTLTAETERLNRTIQVLDATLAATPNLITEEV